MDTVCGRLCVIERLGIFVRSRSAVVWEVVVKTPSIYDGQAMASGPLFRIPHFLATM